jgi:DNA replication protein DnaC
MSVKDELWTKFTLRHAEAVWQAAERKEQAYKEHPVLLEMDREINEAGARYCAAMTTAGDPVAAKAELEALQQKREEFLKSVGADFEPRYRCNICQDTGMGPEGMCECFKRELIAENFRNSNLDRALADQSFENFDFSLYSTEAQGGYLSPRDNMKNIYNLCKAYTQNFAQEKKNLLFTGATGLGKTYLSTAIARELLEQGKSVIYISAPEFVRRMESVRFKDEEGQLEQFFSCDLLILDDLGTENRTAYTMATLADIIDYRLRMNKKIIFSTNLNLDALQKFYDERVVSRLLGHFSYCYFYGDDLRIKAFKEGL